MTASNRHSEPDTTLPWEPFRVERDGVFLWRTSSGDWWLCAEYDHGPFCRLCQPISDRNGMKLALVLGVET